MSQAIKPFSIAIVGGGIGGLSTAIGLIHQNIPVTIYESAPAFAEIGAGVSLGPNAAQAMKLIDPRMYTGFMKCGTNSAWPDRKNFWFSFRRGDGEAARTSVHRARFLDELIALVPKEIAQFGKRLREVDDNGDHVVLHFEDGTSARHLAVIGCDGVKSQIRKILLGPDHPARSPQFTGKYCYRGLIPMHKAVDMIGDEFARNSQMYGHILTFPVENGKIMNVVAFRTHEDDNWTDTEWVKPMDKSRLFSDFAGWVPKAQEILNMMPNADMWALFDHPPAPVYFRNRICMLGDAAHSSTPHQGAGAGIAIEDALITSSALALANDEEDIPRSFEVFDALQRPRSQKLVTTSRDGGLLYDMQLSGVGDDIDKIKDHLSRRMEWIWEVDLRARVKDVKRRFNGQARI
ncbi:hypothetical protein BDV97DRAFT_375891 [Delphinella strobiligena]|nr:hypothetical protein BDV97DRAFT_375891 [Delphinella strobiligena]